MIRPVLGFIWRVFDTVQVYATLNALNKSGTLSRQSD